MIDLVPRMDSLFERLALADVERAMAILDKDGTRGLVAHAAREVADIARLADRLDELAKESADPVARRARVARFLRATAKSKKALAAELVALDKDDGAFDLATLAERIARIAAAHDLSAEAALITARRTLDGRPARTNPLAPIAPGSAAPPASAASDPSPASALSSAAPASAATARSGAPHKSDAPPSDAPSSHPTRQSDAPPSDAPPADTPSRTAGDRDALDAPALIVIARTPGRWTRRAEAIGLLVRYAEDAGFGHTDPPGVTGGNKLRAELEVLANALADRKEHRWVQPFGIMLLTAVDRFAGVELARARLAGYAGGDDFLVRERIVDMAVRGVFGVEERAKLLAVASADPSDHVRMAVARGERDGIRLVQTARYDDGHKVRATAVICLSRRLRSRAVPVLAEVLENEPHGFVVETAAEELAALAARGKVAGDARVIAALGSAAARSELSADVRARVAEVLAEVAVLSSPLLRPVHDLLAPHVRATPVGGRSVLVGGALDAVTPEDVGRILCVLAREDFGLGIDKKKDSVVLYRGDVRTFAWWRVLHEIVHPSPSKRQAFVHTWGKAPAGAVRAPPGRLAELTATRVPGERVLVDGAGGWGAHLPLVDDLLSVGLVRARPIALHTPAGVTTIAPPPRFFQRVRAWLALTVRYTHLAELRRRALASDEPRAQAAYLDDVRAWTALDVRFTPHAYGRKGATLPPPRGLSPRKKRADGTLDSAPLVLLPAAATEVWRDLVQYANSPEANRLPHLTAYALVVLFGMLARGVAIRRAIDKDRAAIPLVIGGWGTRGKSGTERLKAGLFQGLGYECLVKTTGCEAMFIHALPDIPAREVFLYRPYDKATVWEQKHVLSIARRFGARVFLWECMALQPDLVNLLQAQWMRDDYSTITNAYPDHEDVQGPSGYDVATVISEFVPMSGRLFTSEDQMLPILRERAKERETVIRESTARDAELVSDDVLARFPYQEHPKNIALVVALARGLGIPSAIALAEMADNVVPDLGVLRTYPEVPYLGRRLAFTNGMSANERTGALSNWRRTGFANHDPDVEPGRWVVAVINNRADRLARSEVFARFVVEDIGAHRHVVIGTNVGGFVGFVETGLAQHLARTRPTVELEGDETAKRAMVRERIRRAFARLKIGKTDGESVRREWDALGVSPIDAARIEDLLAPGSPDETPDEARAAIDAAPFDEVGAKDGTSDPRPFLRRSLRHRRILRALQDRATRDLLRAPAAVDRAYEAAYRAVFADQLAPLHDASLTGDAIIDRIARDAPPGARVTIHGVQNIKGTGLDFVYRWVSLGMVDALLTALENGDRERRAQAIRALLAHGDYGLVDAAWAVERILAEKARDREGMELAYEPLLARLGAVVSQRTARLSAASPTTPKDRVRRFIGVVLDSFDSMHRRTLARRVEDALIAGHISHATAALRMRAVVGRMKGGWMKRA